MYYLFLDILRTAFFVLTKPNHLFYIDYITPIIHTPIIYFLPPISYYSHTHTHTHTLAHHYFQNLSRRLYFKILTPPFWLIRARLQHHEFQTLLHFKHASLTYDKTSFQITFIFLITWTYSIFFPPPQTVSFTTHAIARTHVLTRIFTSSFLMGWCKNLLQNSLRFHNLGLLSWMAFLTPTKLHLVI